MNKMICFDLDGTLWDTAESTYKAVNNYLKLHGYFFRVDLETIAVNMGNEFEVCAKNYFPNLEIEEACNVLRETFVFHNEMLKDGRCSGDVYEGVFSTLEELSKKYVLCIVSNCANEIYIENFLKIAGVQDYIKDSIPASKYPISKGEAIQRLKEKYSVEEAIYVGDTSKDQQASEEAGCQFIHAKYGFGKNVSADYIIDSFSDLLDLVPKIFKE